MKKVLSIVIPILIISILGISIYSNTFTASFHFDDNHSIVDNSDIKDIGDIKAIWNSYFLRFVGNYSFALNYHFHKLDVFGYHVVNLAIHLLTALSVMWLTLLILSTPSMKMERIHAYKMHIALACALVFISHPLQTQAVTYIVQRYASLAALFYILSLCFYMKARLSGKSSKTPLFFALSALSAMLGMLTKETVVTLPFAMIMFEAAFLNDKGRTGTKPWLRLTYIAPAVLFSIVMFVLATVRYKSILRSVISQRILDPLLTPWIYLITQFSVVATYLRLLVFPVNQNLDYDFPASLSIFSVKPVACLLLLTVLMVIAFRLYKRNRLMSVGIMWFFLALSVESSIITLSNVIFEHRLYLPMFGYCLFLVGAVFQLSEKNKYAAVLVIALVIGFNSVTTYNRNKVWENEFTLWGDVIKKSPEKARAYNNIGVAYFKERKFVEAAGEYQKALALNPEFTDAHHNLGNALRDMGRTDDAVREYNLALKLNPNLAKTHNNLGMVLSRLNKRDEAILHLIAASQLDPSYIEAHNNLGNTLRMVGRLKEALSAYDKALSLDPEIFQVHCNIGRTYQQLNQLELAEEHFKKAVKINSRDAAAFYVLGTILKERGKFDEAIVSLTRALALRPGYVQAQQLLDTLQPVGGLD